MNQLVKLISEIKTTTGLTPKSAFAPLGVARLNGEPITNRVFCFPKVVTAPNVGLNQTFVVFVSPFWVISKLAPIPATVF